MIANPLCWHTVVTIPVFLPCITMQTCWEIHEKIKTLCERTRELNGWMKCLKLFASLIFIPRVQCSTLTFLLICPFGQPILSFWLPTYKNFCCPFILIRNLEKMLRCFIQACLLVLVLQQWLNGCKPRKFSLPRVLVLSYSLAFQLCSGSTFLGGDFFHFLFLTASVVFTFSSAFPFIFLSLFSRKSKSE